ncbi:MAG TPA: hypothetical protein VFA26_07200, partial [Gemmataceae bacterium]|nr:hypothetical protein [Gemmataceae bacterium]
LIASPSAGASSSEGGPSGGGSAVMLSAPGGTTAGSPAATEAALMQSMSLLSAQQMTTLTKTSGGKIKPLAPPSTPVAHHDDAHRSDAYIAYSSANGSTQLGTPVLNVSADAGVLYNDTPSVAGDQLEAVLSGQPIPGMGGSTQASTTLGGTVRLFADGSFSYQPPAGLTSDTTDSFLYYDAEVDQYDGSVSGTSSVVTVEIYVSVEQNLNNFWPTYLPALDNSDAWPRFHADSVNSGDANPNSQTRAPEAALAATWQANVSTNVVGSPVVGIVNGTAPAVFVQGLDGFAAVGGTFGNLLWKNTTLTGSASLPGSHQPYPAPALAGSSGVDRLLVGTGDNGSSFADGLALLSPDTGTPMGFFQAQETYSAPVSGYPNGLPATFARPTASSPAVNPALGLTYFGSNGAQNPGPSGGKVYALDSRGRVVWETLLAGPVEGTLLVTPPSGTDPDGAVYVGSQPNGWTGHAGQLNGGSGARFYKLNARTGAVEWEAILGGGVSDGVWGATALPDASGDFNSTGATIFFTNDAGELWAVRPQASLAPPPHLESLTFAAAVWGLRPTPGINPTTPALSITARAPGTGNPIVYFGDAAGLHARDAGTGAVVFDFTPAPGGSVLGAPAVVVDPALGVDEVIFGTQGGTSQVFNLNGLTGATISTPFQSITDAFVTAPAIGPALGGANAPLIFGSNQGNIFSFA